MSAWVPVIVAALDFAIQQAKTLGLPPPVADEIDKIKRAVDDKISEVLPLAIVGVAVSAIAEAAKAEHEIESLGHAPHCPKCGAVCTQHVVKQIDGPALTHLECKSCGWNGALLP